MESLLQSLLTQVLVYKYVAIFCVTFIGSALPIPSNSVVTASSFFALQGYLELSWVFFFGFLGNVTGDLMWYFLARKFGISFFKRIGFKRILASAAFVEAERGINIHPFLSVFTSRFVTVLTPVVTILAGISRVSFVRFVFAEVLGVFGAMAFACIVGVVFGENWQYVQTVLGNALSVVLLAALLFALVFWRGKRKRGVKRGS